MNRRRLLSLAPVVVLTAGCVELESAAFGGDEGDEPDDEDDDDEPFEDAELERLRDVLEASEVDILELERDGEAFHLEMQTGGNVDTDINRVASAYSAVATEVEGDLTVRIEDRGLTEGEFEIEHEWAEEHNQGTISDGEYMAAVMDTL